MIWFKIPMVACFVSLQVNSSTSPSAIGSDTFFLPDIQPLILFVYMFD